jgi:antitoxin component YwqK of YwqJK toxin-antitoxin module
MTKHIKTLFLSFFILIALLGSACSRSKTEEAPTLLSINIIDRNGLNETITIKERLEQYEKVDFRCPQSYQKVLRIYKKDYMGNSYSYVTTYYENGQVKQYLEAVNNRAFGLYQEWFENGTLKLEANIIGGIADLTPCAEKSWQYDGCAQAWDENGCIQTEISYNKGLLEGNTIYYHPNGRVWKLIPYHNNQVDGTAEYYLDNGQLLQTIHLCNGILNGSSLRFWNPERIAADEFFNKGLLMNGQYFDSSGMMIAEITEGEGYRATFAKESVYELQEFHDGKPMGEVRVFDENGNVVRLYHIENNLKDGEECEYQISKNFSEPKPKLLITWYKGKIQGYVKTWYDNGNIESQREMVNNRRNGMATAWYRDGSLMLIEEYDQDRLVKGEYYKKGDRIPVSEIMQSNGIATIFDAEGRFIRKISYYNGKPQN